MRTGYAVELVSLYLALTPAAYAARFQLTDKYIGYDFLNGFNWETLDDPTHGRVNFVDQQTALHSNLSFGMSSCFQQLRASLDIWLAVSVR